jgi:putative resolvase
LHKIGDVNTVPIEAGRGLKQPKRFRDWAKENGLSYYTAWRWNKSGLMPKGIEVRRMPSGMLLVYEKPVLQPVDDNPAAVVYASINVREDGKELERQAEMCISFCLARGWQVSQIVKERAGGPGAKQTKLLQLIESRPKRLVVLHRNRLSRYNFELIKALLFQIGCHLVVADESSNSLNGPGAMEDLIEVIALTFRKHYGPKKGQVLFEKLRSLIMGAS